MGCLVGPARKLKEAVVIFDLTFDPDQYPVAKQ
jgi:hypothetical protein